MASGGKQEAWRWYPPSRSAQPTIVVSEPTKDQAAERQKKVDDGAEVVPFGFSRALPQEEAPTRNESSDWEGDL